MSKADNTQPLTVMGLMSGTSVDGVDGCLAKLEWLNGKLQFEILETHSESMPPDLRQELLSCMAEKALSLETLCRLNVTVGKLFADTALALMEKAQVTAKSIDCIGSHGQTIYHWPPTEPGKMGGTMQIGEPSIIAEKTGVYTIADFRPRDMAAGGQGAPLVCFADLLLFQDDMVGRCIQNIGGIANVTMIPPRDAEHSTPGVQRDFAMLAFDTGPGNMLMDAAMIHFFQQPYDADGATAARGQIQSDILDNLMQNPYLEQLPPKTTGRELFGAPYLNELLSRYPNRSGQDWLATLNAFTAQSIIDAYTRFIFPNQTISDVIIGGGGARNATLLQSLREGLQAIHPAILLKTHADFGIPDQYKESLAFAILAWSSLLRRHNNIPGCTGATHPVILGKHIPA